MAKIELYLLIICSVVLIFSGCNNTQIQYSNQQAIANPASEKCIKDGGQDRILNGQNGQYGLCLFPDGTVCEEWAYYNGNCKKGECARKCDNIGTRSEGWYDCNGSLLFWDSCANETPITSGTC
jgi:uncharacterized protein